MAGAIEASITSAEARHRRPSRCRIADSRSALLARQRDNFAVEQGLISWVLDAFRTRFAAVFVVTRTGVVVREVACDIRHVFEKAD